MPDTINSHICLMQSGYNTSLFIKWSNIASKETMYYKI